MLFTRFFKKKPPTPAIPHGYILVPTNPSKEYKENALRAYRSDYPTLSESKKILVEYQFREWIRALSLVPSWIDNTEENLEENQLDTNKDDI